MSDSKLLNDELSEVDPLVLESMVQQYSAYTTALTDSSNARRMFHTVFISIHSIVFALIGLSAGNGTSTISVSSTLLVYADIVGIIMSILWWVIVMKYRKESRVSLKLLGEAEKHLPFAFFTREYEMKREGSLCIRMVFKLAEPSIPWIFAVIHSVIGFGIWFGFLNFGVAS